ncbi:hypothetical protein ACIBSV_46000 [Embleya sp. NPDC050154]|uniref:hypothetical protein n=1 Tax=Embleya sp. NPDC050154 TaxID=3363988 RepID=UPI0037A327A3
MNETRSQVGSRARDRVQDRVQDQAQDRAQDRVQDQAQDQAQDEVWPRVQGRTESPARSGIRSVSAEPGGKLRTGVIGRLNDEWDEIAYGLRGGDALASWSRDFAELGAYGTLAELQRGISAAAPAEQDALLIALLTLADSGVALAGRVLLQQMLPHAVRLASARRGPGQSFDDAAGHVLGCLYEVIRAYPYRRRTGRVAANLACDTLHRVVYGTGAGRRRGHVTLVLTPDPVGDTGVSAPFPALERRLDTGAALVRGVRLGVIDASDPALCDWRVVGAHSVDAARGDLIALLVGAVEEGVLTVEQARMLAQDYRESAPPAAEIAASRGISYASLRQRHSRAVRRLREAGHGALRAA